MDDEYHNNNIYDSASDKSIFNSDEEVNPYKSQKDEMRDFIVSDDGTDDNNYN